MLKKLKSNNQNPYLSQQKNAPMIKQKLDWQKQEVTNIWDEASLWAAPFGQLLLSIFQ